MTQNTPKTPNIIFKFTICSIITYHDQNHTSKTFSEMFNIFLMIAESNFQCSKHEKRDQHVSIIIMVLFILLRATQPNQFAIFVNMHHMAPKTRCRNSASGNQNPDAIFHKLGLGLRYPKKNIS